MSVQIQAIGLDRALAEVEGVLSALSGKRRDAALAKSLNSSLTAGRKEAAREARKAYTAPIKKLFDDIIVRRARRSQLYAELVISSKRGVSLIHFRAKPISPHAPRPSAGVSAQARRQGSRHPWQSDKGGGKSFIMRKKQGGYGVFVRHKAAKKDSNGEEKDAFEMLFGPSPVQALQRKEVQERIVEVMEENFSKSINDQIDNLLEARK